jgi:hypothetical protein
MIRILLISIMSSVFLIGLVGVVPFNLSQNTYAIQPGKCPDIGFLWKHTYGHPGTVGTPPTWSRFVEHADCVVAKGVIENDPAPSDERDGDLHFLLTPDKGYGDLLNKFNTKGLMVEIICLDKKGIADSYTKEFGDYCMGVNQSFPALHKNDHVVVTGKWVQDVGHPTPGHPAHDAWNEIHPAEKVEIK